MTQAGWWPLVLAKGLPASSGWAAPGVVLLDEAAADDEESLHQAWRRWLQVYNTMQFLPGMLLATATGLDGQDYEALAASPSAATVPPQPASQPAMAGAWQEVLGQALPELVAGLTRLAQAGATPPEVGLELADEQGRVLAEAELAWTQLRVAVLRSDQEDGGPAWIAAGWRCLVLDGAMAAIDGVPWVQAVGALVGADINETGSAP
jgi:DEAD/DEAH box helicase domain-containing protein